MELKQLDYFLKLAQFEHMSKTADILGITQPTLSKSISSLEKELGVNLFDRIGNRIKLNSNGQQFFTYLSKSMELLESGISAAKNNTYEVTGHIAIASWCFAPILMPCIKEYTRLNPLTDFCILQTTTFGMGQNDDSQNYDFILRASNKEPENVEHDQFWYPQKLFDEHLVLVVHPAFPDYEKIVSKGEKVDLSTLSNAPFVTMQTNTNIITDITYPLCQSAGFWPKSYFQTDDFVCKIHSIRNGETIGFLPESCLPDARLLAPGLTSMPIKGDSAKRNIYLERKKKKLLSEASLDFWNFVLDYYNLPPDDNE